MFATRLACVLAFVAVFLNFERINSKEAESMSKKHDDVPSSMDSRLFDLGGFINQLFPGFNQGNQARPGRNPSGIDFPSNSQFYPVGPIQNTPPPRFPYNQPTEWSVLDDAKYYPNPGHIGNVQPGNHGRYQNKENFGGFPQSQYLGVGNGFGQYTNQGGFPEQYPNQRQSYPNQVGFGGFPQIPNQPDFGTILTTTENYPNWGASGYQRTPYPTQGSYGFSNKGISGGFPSILYPEDSYYEDYDTPYPGTWGGSSTMKYPNQGGFNSPNNFRPGGIGDENINTSPEPQIPSHPDMRIPNETSSTEAPRPERPSEASSNENGQNAILGKPVVVPETTNDEGQIKFPDSSERSAVQKQCVQDCQSSTEYNPVCGTNNVTYINPGKFVCARNCGVHVFVKQKGRCRT